MSLCSYSGSPYFPLHESVSIKHCCLDWDKNIQKRRRKVIRQLLSETDADIITCNVDTGAEALLYKHLFKGKLILTQHSTCNYYSVKRRVVNALISRFADAFVVLTEYDQKNYRKALCKAQVIPNTSFVPVSKRSDLQEPMLMAMGRMEPEKGFDLLIDAFAMVAPKHRDWKLFICGDGSLSENYKKRVVDLGIENRVVFPGFVSATDYMSRASGFILSSRKEGFPIVILEAIAHGLPIVAFQLPSVQEIFKDGGALIAPCEDIHTLADRMDHLMGSANLRSQLNQKSLEVHERYTVDAIAQQWAELFQQVLKK